MGKFVALSLLTFGIYEAYWSWKNWRYVKQRDASNIVPWGRALLCIFWYYPLLCDLNQSSETGRAVRGNVILLAAAYFLLHTCSGLPDPLSIISLLSIVALLPAIFEINRRNPRLSADYARNSSWGFRHAVLVVVSLPLCMFVYASTLTLIPNTEVVPSWRLWGRGRDFLERAVLQENERPLYFYAGDLISFSADGNLLTDQRVVSYWEDYETGEFFLESASFPEIAAVQVSPGSWLDDTVVTIYRHDHTSFELRFPRDEGGARLIRRLRYEVKSQGFGKSQDPDPGFGAQ